MRKLLWHPIARSIAQSLYVDSCLRLGNEPESAHESVFFRTPNELVEAGKTGAVNAIVAYVPISRKPRRIYKVLDWFSNDYPWHPAAIW